MLHKKIIFLLWTVFSTAQLFSQRLDASNYPIQKIDLRQVRLSDSFWLPKIRQIQQVTIPFALQKCEEEGRFENFLTAEKVMKGGNGKVRGKMPFDDTDPYKIIEGASLTLVSSPDSKLEKLLDNYIAIIARGQEQDGYLTTWRTINPAAPPAKWVGECRLRWDNLEMSHELYNSGHLFEAAATHFYATGKKSLLKIAIKNADLLVNVFGNKNNYSIPGHEIVETGLIKLYLITKNREYFNLSKKFIDLRGSSDYRTPRGAYWQDHKPVLQQTEVVGHAVRAVYLYAGITDIAAITGKPRYRQTIHALWDNMLHKKMYVTGGIGARHEGEAFGKNYELPNLTAYNETCAAIGGVLWADRMFRSFGDAGYYNVLERMLYNGVLSGISLDGKAFFYPNPLESDGIYRFNQGHLTRAGWFDCPCCPTNLIRFLPSIPALIYGTDKKGIYINLFVSNDAKIPFEKTIVNISQTTNYPKDARIKITVDPVKQKSFKLRIRVPDWATNSFPSNLYQYKNKTAASPIVYLNGNKTDFLQSNGFIEIDRRWKSGDRLDIDFPLEVLKIAASDLIPENSGKQAIQYGPFIYCLEEKDNPTTFGKDFNPTTFKITRNASKLGGINEMIANDKAGYSWSLIPYYTWSNRGIGKMKVWF